MTDDEVKLVANNERWRAIERAANLCDERAQKLLDPDRPSNSIATSVVAEVIFLAQQIRALHDKAD